MKNLYRFLIRPSNSDNNDPVKFKLSAIFVTLSAVTPSLGSIKTVVISCGVSSATFSISIPPIFDTIKATLLVALSIRQDR